MCIRWICFQMVLYLIIQKEARSKLRKKVNRAQQNKKKATCRETKWIKNFSMLAKKFQLFNRRTQQKEQWFKHQLRLLSPIKTCKISKKNKVYQAVHGVVEASGQLIYWQQGVYSVLDVLVIYAIPSSANYTTQPNLLNNYSSRVVDYSFSLE